MHRLVVSRRAQRDLRAIRRYVARDAGPAWADELIERILAVGTLFATQPRAGQAQPGLGEGVRSCQSGVYLVFYRLTSGVVEMLRVIHGRRDLAVAWHDDDGLSGPS